jgi:N6-L-threonylcarbamoyladenine synthase
VLKQAADITYRNKKVFLVTFVTTDKSNEENILKCYNIPMIILAIETSCDDTSVAVIEDGHKVLSSVVSSQLEHAKYGGVVPEVAAREHIKNIIPCLELALKDAKVTMCDIDAIAVTKGPGLIGSLISGVNTARTLAVLHDKPLIAVHHTEGHIYANWLGKEKAAQPKFPLVCLTVSGGHTNIIYMSDHLNYQIIGETHDDAAGEAFDKVAKMLGLGYPGGPIVSKNAEKGSPKAFNFPRTDLTAAPARNSEGFLEKPEESLDFSYSGLKTAVLREVKAIGIDSLSQANICDIAASFEDAATDILNRNLGRAIIKYQPSSVLLSGGVAANKLLRNKIKNIVNDYAKANFYAPTIDCCTDNAAMIGAVAYQYALRNMYTTPEELTPDPNYKMI